MALLIANQDEIVVQFDTDGMTITQHRQLDDNDVIQVAYRNIDSFVDALTAAVKAMRGDA